MRLIDADRFKKYITDGFERSKPIIFPEYKEIVRDVTDGFIKDIDEQPTVDTSSYFNDAQTAIITDLARKLDFAQERNKEYIETIKTLKKECMTLSVANEELETKELERSLENPTGWIPCSERLPKEHEVSREDGSVELITDIVLVTCKTSLFNHVVCRQMVNGEWNTKYDGEVIAWQPLPKPYEGD